MAIINTKLGGTDASDGDVLSATNLNDTFDATNTKSQTATTETEVVNSATETLIGEIIITGGTYKSTVITNAGGEIRTSSSLGNNGTIKLYTGTNASFGSNTLRKTIERVCTQDGESGWTLNHEFSEGDEDLTGTVYIQITGTNSNATTGHKIKCDNMICHGN